MRSLITLTTDFGHDDWFVGTLKGVILAGCPDAQVVDLTHGVPPGDVWAGAFAVRAAYAWFPQGTLHVVVVDPGVGSSRAALAVRTRRYGFVGPDNGVLSLALAQEEIREIRRIENGQLCRQPVSATFQGRDVFAPVAAYLAQGGAWRRVGAVAQNWVRLEWPEPQVHEGSLVGRVLYVDRFGNAITNIGPAHLEKLGGGPVQVRLRGGRSGPVAGFYGAVPVGAMVAVVGSSGYLEVAVHRGSAAERLRLRAGDPVRVTTSQRCRQDRK